MSQNIYKYSTRVGEEEFTIEAGRLAFQANGAVTVRQSDTIILSTATMAAKPREGADFFPLTVDYEERLYAAGKIPGSFFKREGKASENAILICRLTDRPIRPLFPKGMRNDVQIVMTALSADQEHFIDIMSIIGASAALTISDIPFHGPVGAVRVGYVDGRFVMNPTVSQMEQSILDLRLAGTRDAVIMIEAGASEVTEELMYEAIHAGHAAFQPLIDLQEKMRAEIGKPKTTVPLFTVGEEIKHFVHEKLAPQINTILNSGYGKSERGGALDSVTQEIQNEAGDKYPLADVASAVDAEVKNQVRGMILNENKRVDGRDTKTVRPLSAEVGLLPRAHGTGLFQRGETQVLTIATLGMPSEAQKIDTLDPDDSKRYLHHYNFPPYSVGETRPMRGPGRREIGHGALAERALVAVIPTEQEFPYTIRLVSEVMSSNGSTSMASVCGSTLALMDAGVPISAPVAGIAMGLVTEGERYAILTDILGMEDGLGDMDFKVAGTSMGITALQLDLKLQGVSPSILKEALAQAKDARMQILKVITDTIAEPRAELSQYAPRIQTIKIDQEKIGALIGPGGKTIRGLQEEFAVKIDVEEDGTVFIAGVSGEGTASVMERIRAMTESPKLGSIYTGKVVRLAEFGVFVEIAPGIDGLVHVSQLADYQVKDPRDVVKEGDDVMVMITDIDAQGKIRLSRRAVLEGWTVEQAREADPKLGSGGGERSGGSRGPRRDGDRGGQNRGGNRSSGGRSNYDRPRRDNPPRR
ncbi:MAG: polyribonucleotide nucleotidyltransferase [Chloroflexota bacterium]|nr:MAG: polyribonucleotide nucleotidyltransferase [Chloroflexota bacterium]